MVTIVENFSLSFSSLARIDSMRVMWYFANVLFGSVPIVGAFLFTQIELVEYRVVPNP